MVLPRYAKQIGTASGFPFLVDEAKCPTRALIRNFTAHLITSKLGFRVSTRR